VQLPEGGGWVLSDATQGQGLPIILLEPVSTTADGSSQMNICEAEERFRATPQPGNKAIEVLDSDFGSEKMQVGGEVSSVLPSQSKEGAAEQRDCDGANIQSSTPQVSTTDSPSMSCRLECAAASCQFQIGDIVRGRFVDEEWYLASVDAKHDDGSYTISWFDGDTSNTRKQSDELRLMKFDQQRACFVEERSVCL